MHVQLKINETGHSLPGGEEIRGGKEGKEESNERGKCEKERTGTKVDED